MNNYPVEKENQVRVINFDHLTRQIAQTRTSLRRPRL